MIIEAISSVNAIGLNMSFQIAPGSVQLRVDDTNAMMNSVWHGVLSFEIDPCGEMHE